MQYLLLYTPCLPSILLNKDIVDIEKPDGICSLSFVLDEFCQKNIMKLRKKSATLLKKIQGNHVYSEKYIKTKIKSYNGKSTQNFIIIKYQMKALKIIVYQ